MAAGGGSGGGVVVTGLGTVGACGAGGAALAAALAAGAPRLSEVDRAAGYHRSGGARLACLAHGVSLAPWLAPAEARRMSPPSKLAVAAARMALAEAGAADEGEESTAVVLATTFGPSSYTEGMLKQIFLDSPESVSPFLFTESVANAAAAQVGIACRARGPNVTIAQREAGALLAVGRGAAEVAAGRVRRALVGVVEEMTPLLHAVLDRFGALARANGDGEERARPLDRRRNGYLAAEGATVLVLEREEDAARRGARPLAKVAGWGSAFDPTAPPHGWGEGEAGLARALGRALARAGAAVPDVGRIVSGASGARGGDRLEARTLRAAWGEAPLPPLVAPKAVTGEHGGGFLAAAVLAAAGAPVAAPAGFTPDPALGVSPANGAPLPAPGLTLITSLAAGGAAAWLLLASK
jgi:3-oxoacyl-[acyl-carrier-protein] synthase II